MQPAPYTDAAGRRDFHARLGAGPVGRPLTRPVAGCPLGFPPWSAVVARDRGVGRDTPRSSREHSSGVFSGRMFPAGVLRSFGDCCPTVGDDAPVLATTCRSAGRAGTVVGKGGPAGPRRAELSAHQ